VEQTADRGGAQTRARILDVAWDLITRYGAGLPMRDIAAGAGISRQALYLHFPSRTALLNAMTRRHDAEARIDQRFRAALAAPTALEALEAVVRTWFEYVPDILPMARALYAASTTDPAAADAWWDRSVAAGTPMKLAAKRLRAEGLLDSSWTPEQAAEFLWLLMHPRGWDDLVLQRGWSAEQYVDRQIEAAKRILLAGSG
jgi:AcrR family transcriptional regulator